MRPSTSLKLAKGSMPLSLAVSISEKAIAAASPPRWLPANSHAYRDGPDGSFHQV
jgi:hypothetical protein